MDDLFDPENMTSYQSAEAAAPAVPAAADHTAAEVPEKTEPAEPVPPAVPEAPAALPEQDLPSQTGAAGIIREIRTMAAQPLPPLSRGEHEIVSDAFGSTLRALREKNHLSIEALSRRTLISAAYINALEAEDYKHLPPPVYVSAYIRRLGKLYGLTDRELANLTAKVRTMMAYELPSELDKTTITYEDDEENDERLRHMVWGAAIFLAVLAAVAVSGIILWAAHPSHKGTGAPPEVRTGTEPFRIAELVSRRPAVQLKPVVLLPDNPNR